MARLLSLNVGLPRDVEWQGKTVRTAIWKEPVKGRRRVGRLNVEGDGQGDLQGHGGENRAVYVYQRDSYRFWEARLGRGEFGFGQFGENFTVDGLADDEVCIGDRYQIGSAVFEVSQPRVTCYRLGIRLEEPTMPALLTSSGRPGFYLRVLTEGEVGEGDAIVKLGSGPEQMTVAQANALLYLPPHPRKELERALRIPALSRGWRGSFEALLRAQDGSTSGNPGLVPAGAAATARPGFRGLKIVEIRRECADVISLSLQPTDRAPLTVPRPGQFVVVRLSPTAGRPPIFRSYSLSGPPSAERYRLSVKIEPGGAAGGYLGTRLQPGDLLDVSEPRGSFELQAGDGPVVLLSAGIGATPVMAMLHALAAEGSPREVWWLHGARNRDSHPFASEARQLVASLARGKHWVLYSRPGPGDRIGQDFDAVGHLGVPVLDPLGVPRDADFYLCGPTAFLHDLRVGLATAGVGGSRIHSEIFGGSEPLTPGVVSPARAPHPPEGSSASGPLVSFARSGLAVRWGGSGNQSLLELAESCDVPVRWSCRTGVCHNCESGLISGSVSYQPEPLDAPAEGNVLLCCARPVGDVVVDI
jgi:MOSC domain-containing protein YiiM/ferredoxin-NADP reductase